MLYQRESAGSRLGVGRGALEYREFGSHGYIDTRKLGSADDEDVLAQAVARLGLDGWELVSVSATIQPGFAFSGVRWTFKRPKTT